MLTYTRARTHPYTQIDIQPTPIFRMRGEVVKGFQRGSKLLGWPTANLDPKAFKDVLVDVPRGVYCGKAMHAHRESPAMSGRAIESRSG